MLIAETMTDNKVTVTGEAALDKLKAIASEHKLWSNPLLQACTTGALTQADFQHLFSQYYLYSKNFSRLIAALMANCENDYFRSKLAENLWEESGEKVLEQRHAEIFRKFLHDALQIHVHSIEFKPYTKTFADGYMMFCKEQSTLEVCAALSLGTEAIVSRLYTIMKEGLLASGLDNNELDFFNIHIACDDVHAATLEEMLLSLTHEKHWFERSKAALLTVLDLRDAFFCEIYQDLIQIHMKPLISHASDKTLVTSALNDLQYDTSYQENTLYHNNNVAENIQFQVQRVPFNSDVLDSRLVNIPAGFQNEYHAHAHETVFLILAGTGNVMIEEKVIAVSQGDIVYVPRWLKHQTRNTGQDALKFFAITDYGFTKQIPLNTESIYRKAKQHVCV